jgi:hypothetical protein
MAISPEKLRELIESGQYDREKRKGLWKACEMTLASPNALEEKKEEARALIDVLHDAGIPKGKEFYIFMGYCPGGKIENSKMDEWIKEGFCEFTYVESESQMEKFYDICVGDVLILKIMDIRNKSMTLSAWGTVKKMGTRAQGTPWLRMDWHRKEDLIVPLMGCTSTVNIPRTDKLDKEMPEEFWDWVTTP